MPHWDHKQIYGSIVNKASYYNVTWEASGHVNKWQNETAIEFNGEASSIPFYMENTTHLHSKKMFSCFCQRQTTAFSMF